MQVIAEVVCISVDDGLGRGFAVLASSASDLGLATIIGHFAAEAAHVLAKAIAAARPDVKALIESGARQEIFGGLRGRG